LQALFSNTGGGANTATGANALYYNRTGADNTGNGALALFSNTTGAFNTASGVQALGKQQHRRQRTPPSATRVSSRARAIRARGRRSPDGRQQKHLPGPPRIEQ